MEKKKTNTQKVFNGVSSQTLVTIVLGVVEIASFSIMSRLLTQEDFGYYAAISAITVVFASFSETGIGSAIVQQKKLETNYINNAFTISLLFGCFISFMLLVLSGPLSRTVADESMKVPLMLMSSTLLLNCLTSVNFSIMHKKLQFLRMGTIRLVALIVTTCIAIWLAYKGYGYYAIITKAILTSILTYFLSLYFCKTRFWFALDIQTFKKIFSFSGWLMASVLFRNIAHQIDRLMMPRLLSVATLGAYNRPKDFVEQISTQINGIFDTALFPVLSGLQDDYTALKSAFRRSMALMNIVAMLITTFFFFNSGLLIRIFFGEQWMELKPVMMIISCSILFNIDGRLADCYLRSLAMTKQQFYFRVFETILNTMGILIGYKWGIIGVAISFMLTNFIAKIIKILFIALKVKITIWDCFRIILKSWRFSVLLIPICVFALLILPNSMLGDVIMCAFYSIIVFVIFYYLPSFVGKEYDQEVYIKLKSYVIKKK